MLFLKGLSQTNVLRRSIAKSLIKNVLTTSLIMPIITSFAMNGNHPYNHHTQNQQQYLYNTQQINHTQSQQQLQYYPPVQQQPTQQQYPYNTQQVNPMQRQQQFAPTPVQQSQSFTPPPPAQTQQQLQYYSPAQPQPTQQQLQYYPPVQQQPPQQQLQYYPPVQQQPTQQQYPYNTQQANPIPPPYSQFVVPPPPLTTNSKQKKKKKNNRNQRHSYSTNSESSSSDSEDENNKYYNKKHKHNKKYKNPQKRIHNSKKNVSYSSDSESSSSDSEDENNKYDNKKHNSSFKKSDSSKQKADVKNKYDFESYYTNSFPVSTEEADHIKELEKVTDSLKPQDIELLNKQIYDTLADYRSTAPVDSILLKTLINKCANNKYNKLSVLAAFNKILYFNPVNKRELCSLFHKNNLVCFGLVNSSNDQLTISDLKEYIPHQKNNNYARPVVNNNFIQQEPPPPPPSSNEHRYNEGMYDDYLYENDLLYEDILSNDDYLNYLNQIYRDLNNLGDGYITPKIIIPLISDEGIFQALKKVLFFVQDNITMLENMKKNKDNFSLENLPILFDDRGNDLTISKFKELLQKAIGSITNNRSSTIHREYENNRYNRAPSYNDGLIQQVPPPPPAAPVINNRHYMEEEVPPPPASADDTGVLVADIIGLNGIELEDAFGEKLTFQNINKKTKGDDVTGFNISAYKKLLHGIDSEYGILNCLEKKQYLYFGPKEKQPSETEKKQTIDIISERVKNMKYLLENAEKDHLDGRNFLKYFFRILNGESYFDVKNASNKKIVIKDSALVLAICTNFFQDTYVINKQISFRSVASSCYNWEEVYRTMKLYLFPKFEYIDKQD